jgi:AraC-like DNA-binding protein
MDTVSASYLASYLETCIESGAERERLLAFVPKDFHQFDSPEGAILDKRFSTEILFQILAETEKITGKSEIGLLCGENLRPESLNEIGTAIMCCKSFRQVILVNRHYQALTQQLGRTNLKMGDGHAKLLWEPYYTDPEYGRVITDVVMAGHATFGRWLSWVHNQKPIAIHLRHGKPDYSAAYDKMFDCPVLYNQADNAMLIDIIALDIPLPQANEVSLHEICKRLDIELAKLEPSRSFHKQVADLLKLDIMNGPLNLPQTARRLGLSPRSLRRNLTVENTNFRQILEQVRQQICKEMLSENVPLLSIAGRLGYSQQSAFNRAFKQWFGMTPKAYVHAQNHNR